MSTEIEPDQKFPNVLDFAKRGSWRGTLSFVDFWSLKF